MLHRPLVLPTTGFAAGIVLAEHWALPLAWGWMAAVLALLVHGAAVARHGRVPRRIDWATVTAAAAACALGALAHRITQSAHSPASMPRLTPARPTLGSLRGELVDTPSLRLTERHGRLAARTAVRIRVKAWRPERAPWQSAAGMVLLTVRGPLPTQACRGSSFEAFGVLEPPEPPDAPGLFDYAAFLRHRDIHRTFRVETVDDLRLETAAGLPWSQRFLPWAHAVLARGIPDDEPARLLRAMTLGWQTPLSGEVDEVFMRAGTMHVFAISGLHIALLTTMVVQSFRALRLSRVWAGALALPLTWAYVAATGWQPSAVRSAVMASVILASAMLQRPSDLLNSLAGAAALILVAEPGQLFQSGFQLSFGAVAGLVLIVPPLERQFLAWTQFDPWVPDSERPGWQQHLAGPWRAIALNLAVGVAALLSSVPMTVHHFNLISPVSLLANLLVVPLSSLALAAASTSLAVAPVAPWLSELLNASGWLWMRGMIDLSRWFAEWPGAWFSVAAPPWPWWLGWYGTLALALGDGDVGLKNGAEAGGSRRWRNWGILAASLWGMAAASAWWSFQRTPQLFVFRQEPGLYAQSPAGNALLDGGRAGTGHRLILPFLRAQGVNHLDLHQLSQGVQRFCGLGPELLSQLPPRQAWVPNLNAARQPILRRYLTNLAERHIPVETSRLGTRFSGWTVIAPSHASTPRNGRSVDHAPILRGEFGGVRVLWVGGAGPSVVQDLLRRPEEARAAVVIAVATAGADPLPEDLLAAANPRLAIVITAPFPAGAQVAPATRDRLHGARCRMLLTDEVGGVQLKFAGGDFVWQAFGAPAPVDGPARDSRSGRHHGTPEPDQPGPEAEDNRRD